MSVEALLQESQACYSSLYKCRDWHAFGRRLCAQQTEQSTNQQLAHACCVLDFVTLSYSEICVEDPSSRSPPHFTWLLGRLPCPLKTSDLIVQNHGRPSKGRMGGVRRKSGKHLAHFRVMELADALGWLGAVKCAQHPEGLA